MKIDKNSVLSPQTWRFDGRHRHQFDHFGGFSVDYYRISSSDGLFVG
ncbi:TPA: hypothetical protein ACKRFJ_003628 [Proteus mirabilis]